MNKSFSKTSDSIYELNAVDLLKFIHRPSFCLSSTYHHTEIFVSVCMQNKTHGTNLATLFSLSMIYYTFLIHAIRESKKLDKIVISHLKINENMGSFV